MPGLLRAGIDGGHPLWLRRIGGHGGRPAPRPRIARFESLKSAGVRRGARERERLSTAFWKRRAECARCAEPNFQLPSGADAREPGRKSEDWTQTLDVHRRWCSIP